MRNEVCCTVRCSRDYFQTSDVYFEGIVFIRRFTFEETVCYIGGKVKHLSRL